MVMNAPSAHSVPGSALDAGEVLGLPLALPVIGLSVEGLAPAECGFHQSRHNDHRDGARSHDGSRDIESQS
jgi:hypothetical protein